MDVTYLCWEGRALECLPDVNTGLYPNGAGDNLACLEAGNPEEAQTSWGMDNGLLGETQMTFNDKYPHCLPSTAIDIGTAPTEVTDMVAWLTYYEAADTPVMYLFGYWDDTSS